MLFRIGRTINIRLSLFWNHAKRPIQQQPIDGSRRKVGMIPDTQRLTLADSNTETHKSPFRLDSAVPLTLRLPRYLPNLPLANLQKL